MYLGYDILPCNGRNDESHATGSGFSNPPILMTWDCTYVHLA